MKKHLLLMSLLCSCMFPLSAMKHFVLISAPGSGKGTFSQYMVHKYGYEHICPGDIFRNEIALQTSLGKKIQPVVERGDYVDKGIVCKLMEQYISKIVQTNSFFILDGFPRAEISYKFLSGLLQRYNIGDKVCFLQFAAKDNICTQRIVNRLVCKKCFTVYSKRNYHESKCNKCQTNLSTRTADTEPIAKKRLQYFHEHIEPLIKRAKQDYETHKISTECTLNALQKKYDQLLTS